MTECPRCHRLVDTDEEALITVCVEPGEGWSYAAPASDPVLEQWCETCAKSGDHYGRVDEEPCERERGDDDGVEYADPRDYLAGLE